MPDSETSGVGKTRHCPARLSEPAKQTESHGKQLQVQPPWELWEEEKMPILAWIGIKESFPRKELGWNFLWARR